MTDQILKDASRLGSALADMASKQIDAALKEFQTPSDAEGAPATVEVEVGALAASVMQVVSKLGTLMVEFSKYDLVRRSDAVFRVGAANAVSTLSLNSGSPTLYSFWVENGSKEAVRLRATLQPAKQDSPVLLIQPELGAISTSERRRASVFIPAGIQDGCTLLLVAVADGTDTIVDKRTVALTTARLVDPNANK